MQRAVLLLVLCGSVWGVVPDSNNCGKPAIRPAYGNRVEDGRIVGGREAVPYSWPWQVQIRRVNHFCGASVISNDWILSAAHCFVGFNPSGFSFRVGRHTKSGTTEPYEQSATVKTTIVHESYSASTYNNDIALVQVSPAFAFTKQVSPVCLPAQTNELGAGENVHVTGWGEVSGSCCSSVLKQAMVPVVSRSRCNQADYYGGTVTANMLCAGLDQGGIDSCQGDSGGPLVIEKDAKWQQFGVVSWGAGCAQPKKPGVYTNVVNYLSWIRAKVTLVEREQQLVAARFRPALSGAAFRGTPRRLLARGE